MIPQQEATTISMDPQTVDGHHALQAALQQLALANGYAHDSDCSPWDFAVEAESLTNLGLTTSDLRWLVTKGYLEHASEVTGEGDTQRRFQPCRHLAFGKRTCFVLTALGSRLAAPQGLSVARTCLEVLPGKVDAPRSRREKHGLFAFLGHSASNPLCRRAHREEISGAVRLPAGRSVGF